MLAFKYFADNDVRKVEIERPRPASGELLVKVLATGICGTDLHIYTHGDWIGKAPRVQVTMGHEFVGEHATQWDFGTSIELIASKKVNVTSLITHTLPLEQALEGMPIAMNSQDAVKVVLTND